MNSTNVISCSFALALAVFEILTFEIFDLEKKRVKVKDITFVMTPFDSKY